MKNISVKLSYEQDGQHVFLNEEDVSSQTRTTIILSETAKKKLQRLALEKRVSISQIVEMLIENA